MPDLSDLSGDEVIKADLHEISGDEVFKSEFSEISQDEVSNGKSLKDAVTKADQRLSPEVEGIKSDPCENSEEVRMQDQVEYLGDEELKPGLSKISENEMIKQNNFELSNCSGDTLSKQD